MEWSVRPADQSDAEAIARIHVRSWREAYDGLLPESYLEQLQPDVLAGRWFLRLAETHPEDQVRVVDVEGEVCGFVSFGPHKEDPTWLGHAGEVHMLYLDPDRIGQGLGRALLDRALYELSRHRCYWVVIWVLANNDRARGFYEHRGLRPDGAERWDPFGKRAVPVVRYAKALNPVVSFRDFRSRSILGRG